MASIPLTDNPLSPCCIRSSHALPKIHFSLYQWRLHYVEKVGESTNCSHLAVPYFEIKAHLGRGKIGAVVSCISRYDFRVNFHPSSIWIWENYLASEIWPWAWALGRIVALLKFKVSPQIPPAPHGRQLPILILGRLLILQVTFGNNAHPTL